MRLYVNSADFRPRYESRARWQSPARREYVHGPVRSGLDRASFNFAALAIGLAGLVFVLIPLWRLSQ